MRNILCLFASTDVDRAVINELLSVSEETYCVVLFTSTEKSMSLTHLNNVQQDLELIQKNVKLYEFFVRDICPDMRHLYILQVYNLFKISASVQESSGHVWWMNTSKINQFQDVHWKNLIQDLTDVFHAEDLVCYPLQSYNVQEKLSWYSWDSLKGKHTPPLEKRWRCIINDSKLTRLSFYLLENLLAHKEYLGHSDVYVPTLCQEKKLSASCLPDYVIQVLYEEEAEEDKVARKVLLEQSEKVKDHCKSSIAVFFPGYFHKNF